MLRWLLSASHTPWRNEARLQKPFDHSDQNDFLTDKREFALPVCAAERLDTANLRFAGFAAFSEASFFAAVLGVH